MAKIINNNNNQEEEEDDDQQQWQPQPPLIVNQLQTNNGNEIRKVPLGYKFCPYDHEILHYLWNKILNRPIPCDRIREVELYRYHPRQLAECHDMMEENEMYFFTPRDRKYKNGGRPNRAAGNGYWKANAAEKKVERRGKIIGHKRTLTYYEGKPPKGDKTNWIMHEFRVEGAPARVKMSPDDTRLDDWVLCRIYYRAVGRSRRAEQRDDDHDDVKPVKRNKDNHTEMSNNLNQIGDTNILTNDPSNDYFSSDIDLALSQIPPFKDYPSTVHTRIPNHSPQPISYSHTDPNLHLAQSSSYSHPDPNYYSAGPTSYSHPDPNHHSVQPASCSHSYPTHLPARPASNNTHHSAQYGQEDIMTSRCIQEDVWGIDLGYSSSDYPNPLMELDTLLPDNHLEFEYILTDDPQEQISDIILNNNDPNFHNILVNNLHPNYAPAPPEDNSPSNAPAPKDNNTEGSQSGSVSESKELAN
ncbi:hypothetical protein LguiB_032375 [Lonicera macranthoides]